MSVILSARRGSKTLPAIPVDTSNHGDVAEHKVQWPSTSPPQRRPSWNAIQNKVLPSISIENSLSTGEMDRLHDIWNGAALSARAHRKGGRRQGSRSIKIPDPISIPDFKSIPSPLSSASLSVKSVAPSSIGTRKGWGFLSARPHLETLEAEKKRPNAIEALRVKAQERLKKKIKYAKSTPDLASENSSVAKGTHVECTAPVLESQEGSVANKLSSEAVGKSVTLEELEEMDCNAIYFTLDPSWRDSQGSPQFKFITPVPDDYGPLERPDSPLLHRHHSLDQLSSVALQFARSGPLHSNSMELIEAESSGVVTNPIDELHSYLEF